MQLDLNLLIALDALLEAGSVTGAAERLHLSPPAMSRTLGRLRRAMNDQVMVRTGRTMTPTPRAVALQAQVHVLVQEARAVLSAEQELDLATLERTFTMQWHDIVTAAVGPGLISDLQRTAPGIRLRFLSEATTDTADLRHGRVDLEIGATIPALPEIAHTTVGHDRLVVAMRRAHPCATGDLTAELYAAHDHLTVSRRGRLSDPVDDVLQALDLRRKVVSSAPTAMAALLFARTADVLVVVPERMSRSFVESLGLLTRTIPLELEPLPAVLAWHQRYDTDLAHTWLRTEIQAALTAILTAAD
ncbi:LysR family transcriptional regulator [Kribbella qitaiheensis]|uniref:LysR family transcriptional regulator n=1 Tax=Kribbella qitaiheensis TaxID=1544730 RepID=A0A7G6WSE6_9ACTN|nr:LysR family transcriptional regulator [Kribbella qitaiheensis]QNE16911.1 LysR family transcriptional regulator [Kribbella qitaiheensis]